MAQTLKCGGCGKSIIPYQEHLCRTASMTPQDRMVEAHREGLRQASEMFAIACKAAMDTYPDDHEAQFAYIAGLAQELRRLATKTQNKGFRR